MLHIGPSQSIARKDSFNDDDDFWDESFRAIDCEGPIGNMSKSRKMFSSLPNLWLHVIGEIDFDKEISELRNT